jgi:3-hydroxybutyryl-CoA dehydrogenase
MGKQCAQSTDTPGFISFRILVPYLNEAIATLGEGVATVADIDRALKLGAMAPMGPLELADFIGRGGVLSHAFF